MPNHVSAYWRLVSTVASIHRELDAMAKRIGELEHSIVPAPVDDELGAFRAFRSAAADAA